MRTCLYLSAIIAFAALGSTAHAAILARYDFNATTTSSDTDFNSVADPFFNAGLTATTALSPNDQLFISNQTITNTTTVDFSKYVGFSVDAAAGYELDLTTISFSMNRVSTPTSDVRVVIRASTDGFATFMPVSGSVLGNATPIFTQTVPLFYQNVDEIEFRFYFGDASASTTNGVDIEYVQLDGVANAPIPEPASLLAWAGLSAIGGVLALRRRKAAQAAL